MILKCFIIATAIEVILCIKLINELYPNGQRKKHYNFDLDNSLNAKPDSIAVVNVSPEKDKANSLLFNVNYFPDVIYPTCILDTEPFYYIANGHDVILNPIIEDVKFPYKNINTHSPNIKGTDLPKSMQNHLSKTLITSQQNIQCDKEEKCEDTILQQDNITVSLEEIEDAESNYSDIIQEDINIIPLCLINHNLSRIEKDHNKSNETSPVYVCDIVAYVECENITNNVTKQFIDESSDLINEMNNNTLLKNSTKYNQPIQIRIKVNIDVARVIPEDKCENTTKEKHNKLSCVKEYNKITDDVKFESFDEEQENNKKSSQEEFKLCVVNIANYTETPLPLFEFSKGNEILYPVLQLCHGNIIEEILNSTHNQDYKENDKNIHEFISNTTSQINSANQEEENDEEDSFLCLIVSLDTLCEMNDTLNTNKNDSTENCEPENLQENTLSRKHFDSRLLQKETVSIS